MDYTEIIEELEGELLDLQEQTNILQAKADGEGRDLTEDEAAEVERLMKTFDETTVKLERRKKMQAQAERAAEGLGRKSEPGPDIASRIPEQTPARPPSEDRGKNGFRSFGQFAMSVMHASAKTGAIDPRLIVNAPSTYSTEGTGEDGGFAVPPDFRREIAEKIMGEESLLGRTDQMTTESNSVTFPADETSPWDSSGGIQAYWGNEAAQMTQSKVALKEKQLRLHKSYVLVPVTEELREDAPTLDGYLRRKVPQKFDYLIQNAIVRGSGAGQPVGILNSDCLVSVAKDTAISPIQQADTVLASNIFAMYSRMYAPCRSRAVWLTNQDIEPQLFSMAIDPNNQTKVPVYLPAGGLSASPYGTLMGRPVVPIESCSTLGDQGDIIFADLSQYVTVTKTGGMRSDISMHLYFDYDMAAFKFVFRIAGMPWWADGITPANTPSPIQKRSCFVTLDARA